MMLLPSPRLLFAVVGLALGALLPAPASAQTIRTVALTGTFAPDGGGGLFSVFGRPSINDLEQVAFRANMTSGPLSTGLFRATGAAISALVFIGDAAPAPATGSFASFGEPVINASGDVAFYATLSGGTATSGLFLFSSGVVHTLVRAGDAAPPGGSFSSFDTAIGLTDAGELVFKGSLTGTTSTPGIFGYTTTTTRTILLKGDPAPSPLGSGNYFILGPPAVNGAGQVALNALLTTGGFTSAMVLDTAGFDEVVALAGDSAPGSGGGTFSSFSGDAPALNASGEVAFQANVIGGTHPSGYFLAALAGTIDVALTGETAPDTGGGTYASLLFDVNVDDDGNVAFPNGPGGGNAAQGLFVGGPSPDEAVAISGDAIPDLAGTYFDIFPTARAGQSPNGAIAFLASTTGTQTENGIFVLPEPGGAIPLAVGVIGLCVGARRRRGIRPSVRDGER